jgi:RHS repeat-associated protein
MLARRDNAPDGRVLGEYGTSATDVKAEFIWLSPEVGDTSAFGGDDGLGGYMPLAVAANDNANVVQLYWVHANHMGVPALYTDASGAAIPPPTGYSAPGFPGQSRTLNDLYYNRYRDYDPTTGRYIQADPIGLAGGASPYSYAMNNPLRYTDPTGEFVPLLVIGGGMLLRAGAGAVFDIAIQGAKLWKNGCDPLDWRNYDGSSILVSAAFGAFIPGPAGKAWQTYKRYKTLSKAPRGLNKDLYRNADSQTKKDIAGQVARGGAGAGLKNLIDWTMGDE